MVAKVSLTRKCKSCDQRRPHGDYVGQRGTVCSRCRRLGVKRASRALRLKKTYGITMEEYDQILILQGGVCGGCGGARAYNLHVDHDHKVERAALAKGMSPTEAARISVRGLACKGCNGMFRDVRDNAPRLRRMADYLDSPPAWEVLR